MDSCGFVLGCGGLSLRRGALGSSSVCGRSSLPRKNVSSRVMVPRMKVADISADSFQVEVVDSDVPVLVDFYATWCGPCKLVAPVMEWAATTYSGQLRVVKIDTEKFPSFVREYDIHGLPTLVIFKEGKNISQVEGAIGMDKVKSMLADSLPELVEK